MRFFLVFVVCFFISSIFASASRLEKSTSGRWTLLRRSLKSCKQ